MSDTVFLFLKQSIWIISIGLGIYFLVKLVSHLKFKQKTKNWKINDFLILKEGSQYNKDLKQVNESFVTLKGWNRHSFIGKIGESINIFSYDDDLKLNKSALWRNQYLDCENTMGEKPAFNPTVTQRPFNWPNSTSNIFEGKVISLMTETECQVYLKLALEKEEFEIAELIRKQLEKYR